MRRLTKPEVVEFVRKHINPNAELMKGNWIEINLKSGLENIFFSQTKPSAAGKGHWKFDFFHTLSVERIGEIAANGAMLILINYVDKVWTILDGADLIWLCTYSSRRKSNDGMVCDIVIERNDEGEYLIRPYDRMKIERRNVEVKPW
jgi:hypothetical protein